MQVNDGPFPEDLDGDFIVPESPIAEMFFAEESFPEAIDGVLATTNITNCIVEREGIISWALLLTPDRRPVSAFEMKLNGPDIKMAITKADGSIHRNNLVKPGYQISIGFLQHRVVLSNPGL